MDFSELVGKLLEDDAWKHEGLALRLDISNQLLEEWGELWEITKEKGRFQTLQRRKRQLITKIMFRLRDSRATAQKRLSLYYGITTDDEGTNNDDPRTRTPKLVDRIKSVSKSAKNKTKWLTSDRELITKLVDETMAPARYLKRPNLYVSQVSAGRTGSNNCHLMRLLLTSKRKWRNHQETCIEKSPNQHLPPTGIQYGHPDEGQLQSQIHCVKHPGGSCRETHRASILP